MAEEVRKRADLWPKVVLWPQDNCAKLGGELGSAVGDFAAKCGDLRAARSVASSNRTREAGGRQMALDSEAETSLWARQPKAGPTARGDSLVGWRPASLARCADKCNFRLRPTGSKAGQTGGVDSLSSARKRVDASQARKLQRPLAHELTLVGKNGVASARRQVSSHLISCECECDFDFD